MSMVLVSEAMRSLEVVRDNGVVSEEQGKW